MDFRPYTTRRGAIVSALVELFKSIDGTGTNTSDLNRQVYPILKFFDDVTNFPAVCVFAGQEFRNYQSGGYKDRFLEVRVNIFVREEDPLLKCEAILEDIETVIESNGRMAYIDKQGATQYTHDITVLSIGTDEGTLDPISIGEMSLRVHY
jgi:hypothetical protein